MNQKKMKIGVVFGEYQPLNNKEGNLISVVSSDCDYVIVNIMNSNKPRTIYAPFTYTERKQSIINANFNDIGTMSVKSYMYDDIGMNEQVRMNIINTCKKFENTTFEIVLYFLDDSEYKTILDIPEYNRVILPSSNFTSYDAKDFVDFLYNENDTPIPQIPETSFSFVESFKNSTYFDDLADDYDCINDEYILTDSHVASISAIFLYYRGHVLVTHNNECPYKNKMMLPNLPILLESDIKNSAIDLANKCVFVKKNILDSCFKSTVVFSDPKRNEQRKTIAHVSIFDLSSISGIEKLPFAISDYSYCEWRPTNWIYSNSFIFYEDYYHIINKCKGLV